LADFFTNTASPREPSLRTPHVLAALRTRFPGHDPEKPSELELVADLAGGIFRAVET
jgi:hypothetical protein